MESGLIVSFFIITVVSAIRYDFGNDYMNYYNMFQNITSGSYSFSSPFVNPYQVEIGWVILCNLFKPLGFFSLILVMSVFTNVAYYQLIHNYVPRRWCWFGVFIYLFTPSLFILQMSMIRQSIAIAIFIYSLPLIVNKKIVRSLLLLAIAFFIHKSAIILLPFIFIGYLPFKHNQIIALILGGLFIVFMVSASLLENIYSSLITVGTFEEYDSFYSDWNKTESFGIGFYLNLVPFIVALFYFSQKAIHGDKSKHLVFLYCISALIIPFSQIIQMIDRMSYYFSSLGVASIPITYCIIKSKLLRFILVFICMFISFYSYFRFFYSDTWIDNYSVFHTIFS